jgi:hypothetical protein
MALFMATESEFCFDGSSALLNNGIPVWNYSSPTCHPYLPFPGKLFLAYLAERKSCHKIGPPIIYLFMVKKFKL